MSDAIDNANYLSILGDKFPSVLKPKLHTVRAASGALEAQELANNSGQSVDDFSVKAQVSFADIDMLSIQKRINSYHHY